MFERILLPLDGSTTAEAIIPQVRRVLRRRDSEVVLLRAVHPVFPETAEFCTDVCPTYEEAASYLRGREEQLAREGLRVRSVLRVGFPAETILSVADEERVSLVAMSTHGLTGFPRWVFGSVTEKVLRACPAPLLVTRSFSSAGAGDAAPVPPEELPIRTLLVPIDGGDVSLGVIPHVLELARLFRSRVVLLYVVELGSGTVHPPERIAEQVRGVTERFRAQDIPIEFSTRKGDPAAEILEACARSQADFIAMTTHGRTGISRWVFGSVTEKLLRSATVPMLVVRAPRPLRSL
ncbi:MAG: universal stress protein [Planctomycetes bacterium]|nr:universal stress protein [Planctomycetota bacterium]